MRDEEHSICTHVGYSIEELKKSPPNVSINLLSQSILPHGARRPSWLGEPASHVGECSALLKSLLCLPDDLPTYQDDFHSIVECLHWHETKKEELAVPEVPRVIENVPSRKNKRGPPHAIL